MLALEMGRTRDELLELLSAEEYLKWMAFLAVREERRAEAAKNAAEGYDDEETTHYGDEGE